MKITYISGGYLPSTGADAVHVMHQCEAFAHLGIDVTLVARKGGGVDDIYEYYGVEKNFTIKTFKRPQIQFIGAVVSAFQVALFIRKQKDISLIYSREVWALFILKLLSPVPFIYETHWEPKGLQRLVESYLSRLQSCKGFVFISDALHKIYEHSVPTVNRMTCCIGHDAAKISIETPESFNFPTSSRWTAGYVGSFFNGYGIEKILEMAKYLPEMDFVIVGGRSKEVDELKQVVSQHKLSNVRLTGFIPPKLLVEEYRGFDVMLAPYQPTTPHIKWISPMKLFEYMSYYKVIMCSDFPVMREIIEDGEDGFLVSAEQPGLWAEKLEFLMNSPDLCKKAARKAGENHRRLHTWEIRGFQILSDLGLGKYLHGPAIEQKKSCK